MVVGLNTPVWIEIGESLTLSDSLHLTVDKDKLLPRGDCPDLNEDWDLEVEIPCNWIYLFF